MAINELCKSHFRACGLSLLVSSASDNSLIGIPYNQTESKWGSVHNIKNPAT